MSITGQLDLASNGDINVNTNKFNVAGSTGNTTIAGTLTTAAQKAVTVGGPFIFGNKVSSTLSGTALAVTGSWHEIDANGNALTTLTGGAAGQLLLITITSENLVVTNTGKGGAANTILVGTTDLTLDNSAGDTLLLMFDGSQWRQIAFGNN